MGPRIVALVLGIVLFLAAVAGMTGLVRRARHHVPVCETAGVPAIHAGYWCR
ncbi:MAG: hypothetical protein QHH75_02045 [Bacillota bacterium]|nr:hypothetical protein [Bacillota bacterium]